MKHMIWAFFWVLLSFSALAQDGFVFQNPTKRVEIPFKFINNLVFIPIKVNGVELNFLLDSGVEETILFSLEDVQGVRYFNAEKINLKGLGSEESIEGLKSTENSLEVQSLKATDETLYIILDQEFNLSSHVGIPVNGIIGYKFFKDNVVEIDYRKHKIFVYPVIEKLKLRKLNQFSKFSIAIEKSKPYILAEVEAAKMQSSKLLVDVGNSDAIWLFQSDSLSIPPKHFEDYLGRGFSGDVMGVRAKIKSFALGEFQFEGPLTAFPDRESIHQVNMVQDRVGSVGGEILKRFTVIFDYKNESLYLKKNGHFSEPFHYNHSGITVCHNGLQWVKEAAGVSAPIVTYDSGMTSNNNTVIDFRYEFKLKPVFEISNIRPNSAAAKAGLREGDVVVTINNTSVHRLTLNKINELLKADGGKYLVIEVERNGVDLKFKFEMIDEL